LTSPAMGQWGNSPPPFSLQ